MPRWLRHRRLEEDFELSEDAFYASEQFTDLGDDWLVRRLSFSEGYSESRYGVHVHFRGRELVHEGWCIQLQRAFAQDLGGGKVSLPNVSRVRGRTEFSDREIEPLVFVGDIEVMQELEPSTVRGERIVRI